MSLITIADHHDWVMQRIDSESDSTITIGTSQQYLLGFQNIPGAYPGFKEGGAEGTESARTAPVKILGCHAHFWSRKRACGCSQTQPRVCSRSNYIIDGRLRLVTKQPAVQC